MTAMPAWFLGAAVAVASLWGVLDADAGPGEVETRPESEPTSTNEMVTGNAAKSVALVSVRLYQVLLSSQDYPRCNFTPSCSSFAQDALGGYGLQGLLMTSDRLLRCNGFSLGHYEIDPSTGGRVDPAHHQVLWGHSTSPGSPLAASASFPFDSALASAGAPQESTTSGVDYYSPANIQRFADSLFDRGDYRRAAAEYQRYLFVSQGESGDADRIRYRIGISLRRAGDPDAASSYFQSLFDRLGGTALGCSALRQMAYCEWDRGRCDVALGLLRQDRGAAAAQADLCPGDLPVATSYLLQADWAEAANALEGVSEAETLVYGERVDELRAIATSGMNVESKSPTQAALMSAVVPGSGRVWLGQTGDGLVSLGFIALTVWAAIDGFQENGVQSVQGWVFGTLAFGFYAGNVYGTAVAAKSYNRAHESGIRTKAREFALSLSFAL